MTFFRVLIFSGLIFAIAVGGFLWGAYSWILDSDNSGVVVGKPLEIQVKPGMAARDIAVVLKSSNLIKSSLVFRFWVSCYGISNKLKPGKYYIKPGTRIDDIILMLIQGREEMAKVMIPEGLTIEEVALTLEATGICSAASFSREIYNPDLIKKIFPDWGDIPGPEGLAFPETYTFSKGVSPRQVAEKMLSLTREKIEEILKPNPPQALSKYEMCILASIVEREARIKEDRPVIASVFYNRLSKGIRLESCATVQYALGAHKERLLLEDLKVNSPFNTYLHAGLPPTPVSGFGESAFSAVASPARTDFFFFVSNASEGHFFSRTLAEHEASKKIFFRERKKAKE